MNNFPHAALFALFVGSVSPCAAAVTYFPAQTYYGRTDSPFYQGIQEGTVYLEDFEDRQLNTPYVSASQGGSFEDKGPTVDEDDGRDGNWTTGGYTWSSLGGPNIEPTPGIALRFRFATNILGQLPEYFGMVFLGGNIATVGDDVYSRILVYDANGVEVTNGWSVLQPRVPRGTSLASSDYDRFAGIHVPGGISRVDFINNGQIDHLQYGYSIPEPEVPALSVAAVALALTRRKKNVSDSSR